MARVDNLENFLTDVAGAIKTKKGTTDKILAANFDIEIKSIETGTKINNQDKDITKNGTYTADEGYTGLGTVIVNVPQTGDVPIKLFKTVEEMNNSTGSKEGDLAVVYREEIQPITEESEFDSCTFPQTVVLKEAFTDNIYGRFRAVDSSSGRFDGNCDLSKKSFRFDGFGDTMVRVQYTSSDGITYTRTDGGEELQEFGTVIKYEPMGPWNNVIGNFMKIGGNHFEGIYTYKNNSWQLAPTQLTAAPDYVYKKSFYGSNGVETGVLAQNISNSFNDANADIYSKVQLSYNNILPRVLTDSDKSIDNKIFIIPVKSDGTSLLDTSNVTNMDSMFRDCSNLTAIPQLDTSNVTNMRNTFASCSNLTTIPLLDTSNVTNMENTFYGCSSLTTIPQLDTSRVYDMIQMFSDCSNLTTIPQLDISNVEYYMWDMFHNCSSLSDDSLNIIMQMCINATSYTGTKTLKYIGLTSEQADKCKTLSNYSAFTSAGWTTGY